MAKEDVNIKVSANVAEAIQMWKAMEAGPEGMAKQLSAMGAKGKTAADGVGASITGMVGKFASGAAAIAAVVAGLKQMNEEARKAADAAANSLGDFGELQQVSKTPAEFAANVARSRDMVRRGIVAPENGGQAAGLVFAMASAGYSEEEKDHLMNLGEKKFVKPEGLLGLAEGLSKYRNVFGKKDAGSLKEITDKVIQAAGTAQASVAETLKAILEVAPSGTPLGMTDEDVGAAFLAVEAQSPNSDLAATKLRSFLDQVNKQKLWKGNLPDTLAGIRQKMTGGTTSLDILGEGRASQAYENLIGQQDFMSEQHKLLETAPSRQLFESQSALLDTDQQLRAAKLKKAAEGRQAAAQGDATNTRQLLFDAYVAERKAGNIESYGGFWGGAKNAVEGAGAWFMDWTGNEEAELNSITPNQMRSLSPGLQQAILGRGKADGAGQQRISVDVNVKGQFTMPDGRDVPVTLEVEQLNDQ